jgi:tetratricopeptide (TPR) repeat protein
VLRFKALSTLLFGVLVIAFCGYAAWRSIRIARADWLANAGTLESLERAIRLEPDDAALLAEAAIYRSDNDDPSAAVDEDLLRAARMNPFNSAVLMTLGLREEFRGNSAQAESFLSRAVEVDHQFKPAWTLANYYYRSGQPDKAWPMIQRILNLDPLGFDTMPVFELCWRQAADNQVSFSRRILSLIPKGGQKPIEYLDFLIRTRRTEAALDAWQEALAAADPADSFDSGTLIGFTEFLAGADRVAEAVTVWNQLVDRGIVHSGHLDPAKGISVADPDFRFAALARSFGWRVPEVTGVFASGPPGPLRFEMSDDEPESAQLLFVFAPVLPATRYHLRWKSDGSSLSSPRDPGFSFLITQMQAGREPNEVVAQCPPLLSPGDPSLGNSETCDFVTPAATRPGQIETVRIDLRYARAPGTTRVSGTLQLFTVRLELAR